MSKFEFYLMIKSFTWAVDEKLSDVKITLGNIFYDLLPLQFSVNSVVNNLQSSVWSMLYDFQPSVWFMLCDFQPGVWSMLYDFHASVWSMRWDF